MKSQREKNDDFNFGLAILFLLGLFFARDLARIPSVAVMKYEKYERDKRQEKIEIIKEAVYGK